MRLFLAAFALSAIVTASTGWAQNDEPLTGGSRPSPGNGRFEPNPFHEYMVARARSESMHRESMLRYYDWAGIDYAHPQVNAGVFTNSRPPVRVRRIYGFPGYESSVYGF